MAVLSKELTDAILIEVAKLREKNISTADIRKITLEMLFRKSPETFLRYYAYVNPPKSTGALKKGISKFFR